MLDKYVNFTSVKHRISYTKTIKKNRDDELLDEQTEVTIGFLVDC